MNEPVTKETLRADAYYAIVKLATDYFLWMVDTKRKRKRVYFDSGVSNILDDLIWRIRRLK